MRRIVLPFALCLILITGCKSNSEKPGSSENRADGKPGAPVVSEKISPAELAAYNQKLSAFFDTTLLNRNFNGSILVAKGGNILYEAYIGHTDPSKKTDTISATTPFHLASSSKPFTGMAVMRLVEAGKIGLDDDIIKYFSGFPYSGVTVRHLLTHRSGLPNYLYFMEDKQKWKPTSMPDNKDVVDFLVRYQPPKTAAPGTKFQYCNTNYVLLASIVEKVTGKTFPQYMKETIFDPLGMKHTFIFTPADSARVIMSYKPSGGLWVNDKYDHTYGDKNVYSTPRDMLKWDSGLYREDFISKAILDSAFIPRSHEKQSIHNYGYGWRMLNLNNGKNVIYHFGKWHGFNPAFARLIDEKAVIIILSNRSTKNTYHAASESYNIFGDYMQRDSAVAEENENIQPTGPVNESQLKEKKPATKQQQPKIQQAVAPVAKAVKKKPAQIKPASNKLPKNAARKTAAKK